MAVIDPGDEVIIPAPYWVSYPDMVLLADGVPVTPYAGPEQGYKITPRSSRRPSRRRRACSCSTARSNPTGAAYTRAELEALGAVLRKHPRIVIAHRRHVRAHLLGGPSRSCSFLNACPDLYDRTVTINGVSKAYAMTGWRIGYCGGPAEIIDGDGDDPEPEHLEPRLDRAEGRGSRRSTATRPASREMNKHFKARHDFFNAGLNALPGFKVLPAAGTFYAWCDVGEAIRMRGLADDNAFAEFLLEKAGVAGVPGSGFGAPGHIRFSFAVSMKTLEQALARIGKALAAPDALTPTLSRKAGEGGRRPGEGLP